MWNTVQVVSILLLAIIVPGGLLLLPVLGFLFPKSGGGIGEWVKSKIGGKEEITPEEIDWLRRVGEDTSTTESWT